MGKGIRQMKDQVSKSEFTKEMRGSFSKQGADVLYEFLCDTEMDWYDPDAIKGDFTEYTSAIECLRDNGIKSVFENCECEEEMEDEALSYLESNTLVLQFDCGIIIQEF